ncbi:MAG: hypothetical protein CMC96_05820 [Flavobacteriales bacterium]|nr:hypothetical protein [Flavobacteriales bacterium]|tara:strand:+ start:5382 stop:6155 length:774 start_codon:yes stop_codon:yes gene_type:complete
MAKILTAAQQIGDIGEQLVGYLLTSRLNIIYRPISKRDTGIDAEIELTELQSNKNYQATGIFIKAQVKASANKKFKKGQLDIKLSKNDKEYFTESLNLPAILFFADLNNKEHEVYWAEVIPNKILSSNKVTIYESNKLDLNSLEKFKKIESFYRSEKFRDLLIDLYSETINTLKSHIENNSDKDEIPRLIDDFNDDLIHIDEVHRLSYLRNLKSKDIPEYENVFDDRLKFVEIKSNLKDVINSTLNTKGLSSYDSYI